MYFSLFVLFLILIIGPIVGSKYINFTLSVMELQQPSDWNNNDTLGSSQTGTALAAKNTAAGTSGSGSSASASASSSAGAARRMVYFTYDS